MLPKLFHYKEAERRMKKMSKMNLNIGDTFTFTKTVGESDVYLFAGISGDFTANHIDEEFMKKTQYGKRIAHGVLAVAFTSTCASAAVSKAGQTCVSLGYDGIRFLKPIFFGDTITTTYTVESKDEEKLRTVGDLKCFNQNGDLVMVGKHILKFLV